MATLEAERPWFRHYPAHVPRSLKFTTAPLQSILARAAQEHPAHTATIFFGARLSYARLDELAWRFANALRGLGLGKGDRLGLFLPNCPQYIICYYGALRAGCTVVPFNPRYKAAEIERQLTDSEAKALVSLDILFEEVGRALEKVKLKHVIVTHMLDYLPPLLRPFARLKGIKRPRYANTLELEGLLREASPSPFDVAISPEEDVAVLLYTGGTTGTPKGAMLTHHNLLYNAAQASAWGNVKPASDATLAVLPFFHSYGMTVCMNSPIMTANTMILLPRFEPKEVLKAINKYRPALFPGVPAMYIALLNHPEIRKYDLRSVRLCLSGAAPLPVEVAKRWSEATGGMIVEGYGLTETSPVTHANPTDDLSKVKFGSIGLPLPDTDAKIVDPEDSSRELGPREVGELAIRGPQVMKGYWKRPEESEQALRQGWLLTGDLAYMDEDGYFYIVDRKKDMINVGGLKALPREIEEVLYQHPAVKMAAVVGSRDERLGEVPKAYVVLKEGFEGKVTKEEIISFCRERLAGYKVPRDVEFRRELPLTLVGKVLRRVLREEELEGKGPSA
ncbi:MAG: long-chain fatty acid--CoA ligase [Nitrososphaerota archaeon]